MGELVEFASNGKTARGYLAAGEGAGPGILVIQEWWGLVDHIEDVCDRFAAEGFTALAPDLYDGKAVPNSEPDEAGRTMMAMRLPEAAKELSGAVDYLTGHPSVRGQGLGVVGFCMGGGVALWLASLRPDQVRACVPFYGFFPWPDMQPEWSKISAAVEGHYAENDDLATPEVVDSIEQHLAEAGVEARIYRYPRTTHAFFNDTRPEVYDEDAARQSWVRTLEFFRAKLG
jgi:carboxymethylenebutenolidase